MRPTVFIGLLFMGAVLAAPGEGRSQPVPGASCGPHDRTESVQGETTLAERFAPGPPHAYFCNVELVGQFEGEGSSADMRSFGNCAYYSTSQTQQTQHPGVAVLDISDPQHPRAASYLDSPVMLAAFESLEIAPATKLLIASTPPDSFELYDLSTDCRHPVLKTHVSFPSLFSHSGTFAPDGRTFYGAKWPPDPKTPPASAVFAIDTSNVSHPRLIATWVPPKTDWVPHGVGLTKDGTRAYVVMIRMQEDTARVSDVNGLVVLDVSDVQARRHNPIFRVVGTLFWGDTHVAQFALPVTVAGRPYVVVTDLAGTLPFDGSVPPTACSSGNPGHGFARIVDVSDAAHPTTASKLTLEVDEPANCLKVMHDPILPFGYGSYGCSVDHEENARLLACGYWEGGLRVFDIHDPHHPREVGYYKPPARRAQSRPGSIFPILQTGSQSARDHTADPVIFPKFRANGDIWFNSADNGFQVVRFTERFKTFHPELFRN